MLVSIFFQRAASFFNVFWWFMRFAGHLKWLITNDRISRIWMQFRCFEILLLHVQYKLPSLVMSENWKSVGNCLRRFGWLCIHCESASTSTRTFNRESRIHVYANLLSSANQQGHMIALFWITIAFLIAAYKLLSQRESFLFCHWWVFASYYIFYNCIIRRRCLFRSLCLSFVCLSAALCEMGI